ncbi:MAG TPA: HNH endonuclease [bacterium]|nr:HNH endonuclease [bacterium]
MEAVHRCAIPRCRQIRVEIAHIVPYKRVGEHTFDNLIALCVDAYDRSTTTWSKAPSLYTKRALSGVGVVNGVLYVVGGAINFGFRSINPVEAL